MNGFFLVNKPEKMTSHDVVFQIKKKFHFDKVGHTGTLDPLASGLLIICVGKATKLAFLFDKLPKTYQGTFLFNKHYDTLDVTGKLLDTKNTPLTDCTIQKSFASFHQKKYLQIPPMFSAVKIKGKKMYRLARKNQVVDIPPREVFIHNFEKTSLLCRDQVDFLAHVSKGTYIRSLARDLALQLNTYGALLRLQRTAIGTHLLQNAKTIENLELNDLILDSTFFAAYDELILNDYLIKLVKNGTHLDQRQITTKKPFIVKDSNKNFVAYYDTLDENKYYPRYFF
ncbi:MULTISPECIES: tRNA pseudouridine(55) synthase TruB [16SrI (Aster yellows group)]|uniref:tRNA pseudouridine synthase B n=1 Tax='Santalum album' aster yellows phytoplasma TaxID=2831467 RepID=A0ABS5LK50_9MOLU|nr:MULTISPECIES: tRNA pseudouridine(55) synthase TruB [16SrI (Aster yellows group)]MBS2993764.1 tRNA pseudouridine(55) synthase TruB ['Santalum album' aster yellows phytoplasma]